MTIDTLDLVTYLVLFIVGLLGFYLRRLYHTIDKQDNKTEHLDKKYQEELTKINRELTEHRMYTAAHHITREELHNTLKEFKDEIRDIVSHSAKKIDELLLYLSKHEK